MMWCTVTPLQPYLLLVVNLMIHIKGFLYRPDGPNRRVRYRFGSVGNRTNSNFKQKHAVQTVPTGTPTVSTGSRSFNKNRISGEFDVFSNLNEKLKNKRKISKNIARCIQSNRVNTFQILVHLIFFSR
jgi:hypothetical protein